MSETARKTPKSGRQSLFYQDLASHVSSRRSGEKLISPGRPTIWGDKIDNSDLPHPPLFTLEDRADFSPEFGIPYSPMSPGQKSDPRTPLQRLGRSASTPRSKSRMNESDSLVGEQSQLQSVESPVITSSWWSTAKSDGNADQNEKGNGSPVKGVIISSVVIPLPPLLEDERSKMENSLPAGNLDEGEWVTVYGFLPADTNFVMREFEKCGVIVKHIPGPKESNWMHIYYQNRTDAQKALRKNGVEIHGILVIGVKQVDSTLRRSLNEKLINQGFMPSRPSTSSNMNGEPNGFKVSQYKHSLEKSSFLDRHSTATMATPTKSVVSKVVDLLFGV